MRLSGFRDPDLKQASCKIERYQGQTAQKQKVTVKLTPGQEDILMTRISTENKALRDRLELEAKEKDVEYRVISSKLPTEGPQAAEAIYIVKASDYTQYGPLLVKLVNEMEHPKSTTAENSGIHESKITLMGRGYEKSGPVELIKLSFGTEMANEVSAQLVDAYPDHSLLLHLLNPTNQETIFFLVPEDCPAVLFQSLKMQLQEILQEEGRVSDKDLNLLTIEEPETTTYINLSDKGVLIGKGFTTEVYAQETIKERKAEPQIPAQFETTFTASSPGKSEEEIEALKRLWSGLERLVGAENLSKINGLQPPFLTGQPYVLSEYYPLELYELIQNRRLDPNTQFEYSLQLLKALFWLQRVGSLHLDLKPENVLVGNDGVIIIDHPTAGPAKQVHNPEEARLAENYLQKFPASSAYTDVNLYKLIRKMAIPPPDESDEQLIRRINQTLELVPKLQVFEMGILLYALVTTTFPYPVTVLRNGHLLPDLDQAALIDPQLILNKLRGKCPPALAQLIVQMIAPHPDQRATIREIFSLIVQFDPEFANTVRLIRE